MRSEWMNALNEEIELAEKIIVLRCLGNTSNLYAVTFSLAFSRRIRMILHGLQA
jgi:hypothetical protein